LELSCGGLGDGGVKGRGHRGGERSPGGIVKKGRRKGKQKGNIVINGHRGGRGPHRGEGEKQRNWRIGRVARPGRKQSRSSTTGAGSGGRGRQPRWMTSAARRSTRSRRRRRSGDCSRPLRCARPQEGGEGAEKKASSSAFPRRKPWPGGHHNVHAQPAAVSVQVPQKDFRFSSFRKL
jgi:hypothetical protein